MRIFTENGAIIGLLSAVWIYLLGLCIVIGYLVVPIEDPNLSPFVSLLIGGGKVIISLLLVILWLISWYKVLGYIFHYELSLGINNTESLP